MTVYELKRKVLENNPNSHFFDRKTLRFFGDSMKNYGVKRTMLDDIPVFELYRKRIVKHGINKSSYFHAVTFDQVYDRG